MKPNIILFIADQIAWRALPAYGNTIAKTPNIDSLAKGGAVIDTCYTTYPLCQPARASFWTSLYPHETGVISNGRKWKEVGVSQDIKTLGEVFSDAGYETVHFGKTHDGGALRGFKCEQEDEIQSTAEDPAFPHNVDTFRDNYTVSAACEYLDNRQDEKPLFMVADIVNPHNICGWVGANQHEHIAIKSNEYLPPLPENFEYTDIENCPKAIQYVCCTNNRQSQTAGWTPDNFREYLQAYYNYLERADAAVGKILDAAKKAVGTENTLFVFISDHGDSMSARGRVTKQVDFYEETTRVPMIFKGTGVTSSKAPISGLTSLLDLFPTLCSYAGIKAPNGLRGVDISKALLGQKLPQREYIASQWHTEWGYTVSPGRMLRTDRYKYTKYIEDGGEELYDMLKDPFEKVNQAKSPEYAVALSQMRTLFKRYLEETADNFESLEWYADERWRSHAIGYQNHSGIAAPMLGDEY